MAFDKQCTIEHIDKNNSTHATTNKIHQHHIKSFSLAVQSIIKDPV